MLTSQIIQLILPFLSFVDLCKFIHVKKEWEDMILLRIQHVQWGFLGLPSKTNVHTNTLFLTAHNLCIKYVADADDVLQHLQDVITPDLETARTLVAPVTVPDILDVAWIIDTMHANAKMTVEQLMFFGTILRLQTQSSLESALQDVDNGTLSVLAGLLVDPGIRLIFRRSACLMQNGLLANLVAKCVIYPYLPTPNQGRCIVNQAFIQQAEGIFFDELWPELSEQDREQVRNSVWSDALSNAVGHMFEYDHNLDMLIMYHDWERLRVYNAIRQRIEVKSCTFDPYDMGHPIRESDHVRICHHTKSSSDWKLPTFSSLFAPQAIRTFGGGIDVLRQRRQYLSP